MPGLSIWFVRAALAHLALGFTFGALMLANKGVPFAPGLWQLRAAHIELLTLGWVLQLALGVAYWILPRFWEGPPRGNTVGAYLAFGLLNGGLWLVALTTLAGLPPALLLVGRLLEAGAVLAFAWHIWPRIVGREG